MSAPETTTTDTQSDAVPSDTLAGMLTPSEVTGDFAGLSTAPIYEIALAILGVAVLLTAIRLLRGPTLPDRVVAVDQLGFFAVGAIALYAVLTAKPVLLSVGIVMALILFLGTAAFAMFIERRARP